jgi:NitT/TauT family transport system permease protein
MLQSRPAGAGKDALMPNRFRQTAIVALSMAAMLGLWAGAAAIAADPQTMPSPVEVGAVILRQAESGALMRHIGATLLRVAWAFSIAMVLGSALGFLLGWSRRLDIWANPWVVVALNLPALVVIVLAYLWIGLNEVAAIAAVAFNKTALVLVTVREGTRALDPSVAEMARVYRMPPWRRLRHVVIPQLAPYLAASARNGLAIIWKLVLVVEFLGRPNGVGFQIHFYFQLFDVAHVLAYSVSFVAIMLAIEYAVIQPAERRAAQWREA